MNRTILFLAAILTCFLLPAMNTQAQITTYDEDGFLWIIVQGTEGDDDVYVVENYGGTSVYLYSNGVLVDSRYFINFDPIFDNQPVVDPEFGGFVRMETAVLANLKGGDDFYYNNAYRHAGDVVNCGVGRDTVYAGPGESWVSSDYWDTGRKEIFGGGGDDWLMSGAGHDYIRGGDGNDYISGNGGNDALHGDAGDDLIDGGTGINWMIGGPGDDTFHADDPLNYIVD